MNLMLIVLIIILCCTKSMFTWTLTTLNISDYKILHVSVYYSRAFLCIKHSTSGNINLPTLIEATWPENMMSIKPRIFPNEKRFHQLTGKCRNVLSAQVTDIDAKGRLWLLDNGSESCEPKLIIYDLLYRNEEIQLQTFNNLKYKKFAGIVVDPIVSLNTDTRAYLSLHSEDYLLIYSFNERKLGKLKFMNNQIEPTKGLAFSEIVIATEDTMFLSDINTGNLYSLNMTPVRYLNFSMMETKKLSIKSPLTYIGMLLGTPKDISIHPKSYLFYILPRDSAVVMWDTKTPLLAEWHEVIYQTSANLTQLLFGQKGSVYAISEDILKTTQNGKDKHCVKIHME